MTRTAFPDRFPVTPTQALWRSEPAPQQVLRVRWENPSVSGAGALGPIEMIAKAVEPEGAEGHPVLTDPRGRPWGEVLLGVPIPEEITPGEHFRVRVTIRGEGKKSEMEIEVEHPGDDWVCFIGAGYHADPVWWNTQRDYTEIGSRQVQGVGAFLDLNRLYLELLESDPDFACALETVPALHPTWAAHPELRGKIRSLVADGRLELMASYDDPQSTLAGCELLCRNIAYGVGFARLVGGRRPRGLAQWDVFGHDPGWPAIARAAGLGWTTFCRGLYHGEHVEPEDNLIPTEFRWVSPDSSELLTHYMSRHYTSGWEFSWAEREQAEQAILQRFERLRVPAPTRNVLLPCYGDFAEPFEGMMALVRAWNEKYLSPRLCLGTQADYLAAVRMSCKTKKIWLPPISRDLNPAFSGCNLSFAETKQAQRFDERLAREAEVWATFANLLGAPYPTAALDRAWRILNYTAHHDAVTGSESDQVYLDLTALWREAADLAGEVRDRACEALAGLVKAPEDGNGAAVTVFNSLGWPRGGMVAVNCDGIPENGAWSAVGESGNAIPLVRCREGWRLNARDVPALGRRTYRIVPSQPAKRVSAPSHSYAIENDEFIVTVDPSKGGGITSMVEAATDREFLQPGGIANDIVVYPEYPGLELAPWRLQLTGERFCASEETAQVSREIGSGFQQLISVVEFLGCVIERRVTLREGEPFLECATAIRGYADRDLLWRAEFPMNLPGARPVAQTSGGVIGRPFGRLADFMDEEYLGDWAVDTWGGLECPLAFRLTVGDGELARTVAVGEIIIPGTLDRDIQQTVDRLVPLLARAGVTTVVTRASSRRAGAWSMDGSRPDLRIAVGGPGVNRFARDLFERARDHNPAEIDAWFSSQGSGACWIDLASEEPGLDLPVAILPDDRSALGALIDRWEKAINDPPAVLDAIDAVFITPEAAESGLYRSFEAGCAILVRGTPSLQVLPDGTIALGLFRSASGCPSGGWIDDPVRRMPDGSHFQHEHWSHRFDYRLMPHLGDWRRAGVARHAEEFNQPLTAVVGSPADGPLPASGSFFSIETGSALLQALRPLDMPETSFDRGERPVEARSGVLLRLREIEGRSTRVYLSEEKVRGVESVDLLGQPLREEHEESSPSDRLQLGPWSLKSLAIVPGAEPDAVPAGQSLEDGLQPGELWPARYWRSSLGPAGWRTQPVFHRFLASSLKLNASRSVTVELQVVNNTQRRIDGLMLRFMAPDGAVVEPVERGPFDLQPERVLKVPVIITTTGDLAPDGGFLSAVLTGSDGVRTVAAIPVNRDPDLPAPANLEVPEVVIVTGADLVVKVENNLGQAVEGMLELILPYEAWPLLARRNVRQSVTIPGRAARSVAFELADRGSVEPGRYYAIAKWHCLEEQAYSASCWVVVPDDSGAWISADQGRFMQIAQPSPSVTYTAYTGSAAKASVDVKAKSASLEIDLSRESKRIPGGYRTVHTIKPVEELLSLTEDVSIPITIALGDRVRRFTSTIRLPSGPQVPVREFTDCLSLDDPHERWMEKLTHASLELSFRATVDDPGDEGREFPLWLGYDREALYLAAQTPWPGRINPYRRGEILRGDCLHLAFFPSRLVEFGFALTFDGPMSWTFLTVMESPSPPAPPIRIDRISDSIIYRTRIPWPMLYLDCPPALLPWNVVVHTTLTGGHWAGAWQLADGTVFRKTADGIEFGLLVPTAPSSQAL